MRWLRRWVFIINMLIEVCLFPYVSDSSHVAVDVQRKQVLVVVETVDLLDSLNQVVEAKTEGITDVIEEPLVIALEDGLIFAAHLLYQLAQVFDLLQAGHDAHRAIDCQIAQSRGGSALIELISYLSVDAKAEVVDEVLGENLTWHHCVLEVLDLFEPTLLLHLHLHFPYVQLLHHCTLPILDQSLQFLEAVLCQLRLLFPPAQISGKIIASAERDDGQMHQLRINAILCHFRDDPHHSSISPANHSSDRHILQRELLEMLEALVPIGPHVVEVDTEEFTLDGEVYAIDLQLYQIFSHSSA